MSKPAVQPGSRSEFWFMLATLGSCLVIVVVSGLFLVWIGGWIAYVLGCALAIAIVFWAIARSVRSYSDGVKTPP